MKTTRIASIFHSGRTSERSKSSFLSNTVLLALSLSTLWLSPCPAETIRVTTCNMQAIASGKSVDTIAEVAASIRRNDPDVILLQQVHDWQSCLHLVHALQPATYSVLVCSAFRQPTGGSDAPLQAAILSKRKAYLLWSEPWQTQDDKTVTGGYAFAAIHSGKHRVGLFSVLLDNQIGRAATNRQAEVGCREKWSQDVRSIKDWTTNRIDTAVVGAGFAAMPKAIAIGPEQTQLANSLLSAPLRAVKLIPAGTNFLARLAADAETLPGAVLVNSLATCDVDLDPEPVAPAVAAASDLAQPGLVANVQTAQSASVSVPFFWVSLMLLTILALAVGLVVLARRQPAQVLQLPGHMPLRLENGSITSGSETFVITARSTTGSATDIVVPAVADAQQLKAWHQRALVAEQRAQQADAAIRSGILSHLAQWLKQKVFRKAVEDRAALLETQRAATIKAIAVEERLSRIEVQLQQQNQMYESRIEALTQELNTAKEESRAIIRIQIAQIKAEMETARAKLLAEAEAEAEAAIVE